MKLKQLGAAILAAVMAVSTLSVGAFAEQAEDNVADNGTEKADMITVEVVTDFTTDIEGIDLDEIVTVSLDRSTVKAGESVVITVSVADGYAFAKGTIGFIGPSSTGDFIYMEGSHTWKISSSFNPYTIKYFGTIIKIITSDGLNYIELDDGNLSVYSLSDETLTDIVIPDTVNGKRVTEIHRDAFDYNCQNIKSVIIPDSVVSIGSWAFGSCTNLESITIPDSVTEIGSYAFSDTPWLENKKSENPLVIVNNILIDGRDCTGNVVVPDSVTKICDRAFVGCKSLKSITIPNSVTSIGEYACLNCTNLTDIYYTGSEDEWNKIVFGMDNDELLNATVHYNSTAPETPEVTEPETPDVTEPNEFESNGVTATADDGVIPDGAVFSVEPKSSNESNTQFSYEINFTLNGEKIQPNGTVTVKIPVPEALAGKTIYVYRVSDSGRYTRLSAEVVDGYVVFKTNHFSEYILSATRLSNPTEDDDDDYTYTGNSADSTTDNNNSGTTANPDTGVAGFSLTVGLIALAGAAVVVSRKKK